MSYPKDAGFRMPAEWAKHKRCWMAWPCRDELWGDALEAARDAYATVAAAIAEFEPVTMIVNAEDLASASLQAGKGVGCLPLAHDDSWTRDTGPTFLVGPDGQRAGVDWRFNCWGGLFEDYERDAEMAAAILDHLDLPRHESSLVLEGGAIHVDGEGTVLATEESLLNANRNPDLSREEVEDELKRYLGVETVIWLGQGLEDDETDGHVDNVACFVKPGVVMVPATTDRGDGNYDRLRDNRERLEKARDARGRELEIVEVRQPRRRQGPDGRRLTLSYVNLYLANGAVIMPSFEDPADQPAFETVSKCFPDREVRQVCALDIVLGGGGIHCITLQEPEAP